ncbi:hypothetical protein MPTK1_6g05210 [Marchantia polymorpha subsp. ruderalis]|uniref:F-box domain-containing protein n=2 Tax=Marchantia polymorpha TaxID=3197 RepID=A0AAF6BNQ8_MARPO|nr:hypothetical protein MARPO_0167s0004 [Marchantia polymorpha]BBN13642.1 hypothetical protein Mp_6g05210 [Marchantia polymorpha subsp. ruderalis]|eukprot:PTQ28311.1 hypothetical protein MARPO_0167s0004 [Marchantia polymorpha]
MEEHEDFPNDLLVKIFVRVPYPEILKVRLLSTEWNRNFRTLVSQACHTWPTYCPLFTVTVMSRSVRRRIGDTSTLYKIGYDCAEGHFRLLGQINRSKGRAYTRSYSSRCGALLVRVVFQKHRALATVINQVTCQRNRVWFSNLEVGWVQPMVFSVGADHYEIVICHYSRISPVKFSVTVYKSVSKDHTTRSFIFERDFNEWFSPDRIFAYDDGVLYLPKPFFRDFEAIQVLQLNMKNGAMNEITVGPFSYPTCTELAVLLCGSRVMCVLVDRAYEQTIASVYHVVPVSSESILLSTWQIEHFSIREKVDKIRFASNRSSIFITECNIPVNRGSEFREWTFNFRSRTVCYDVDANILTSIDTPFCQYSSKERLEVESCVFEPGLNPLASP